MAANIDQLIAQAAARHGIPEAALRRYVQIESGGNPGAVTGSYKGLLQLSEKEFRKHGGSGSIFDPAQNLNAGAAKLAEERSTFAKKFGREPSQGELYLMHQQGWGGLQAHLANPDQPAWKSMASTGEGRAKGDRWAKLAISGNIPRQWGVNPETITSREFVDRWTGRSDPGSQVASAPPASQNAPVSQNAPADALRASQEPMAPTTPPPAEMAAGGAPGTSIDTAKKQPETNALIEALSAMQGAVGGGGGAQSRRPEIPDYQATNQRMAVALLGARPIATMIPALAGKQQPT